MKCSVTYIYSQHDQGFGHSGYLMSFCFILYTCSLVLCCYIVLLSDLCWYIVLPQWSVTKHMSFCINLTCVDTCLIIYYVLHQWSVLTRVSLRIAPVICTDTCFNLYCCPDLYWHMFHYALTLYWHMCHSVSLPWPVMTYVANTICTDTSVNL